MEVNSFSNQKYYQNLSAREMTSQKASVYSTQQEYQNCIAFLTIASFSVF